MFDFLSGSPPPALRRTVCELSFGSGSTADWQAALVWVRIQAGLAPAVNVAEIILAAGGQSPAVAVGDTGTINLGYDDSGAQLVFTGAVQSVRYSLDGQVRVTAVDGSGSLAWLRINQSYEKQKAGDIVRDLAGRASVSVGNLQDGIDFPFYVVDDRSSAYQHIAGLARKCGFLAYLDPQGELVFAPFTAGQPAQTFTYAQDILALLAQETPTVVGSVTVTGEGAASSQGQDAWNWLIKDPSAVQARSGSGGPERFVTDSSLRSAGAAQQSADGLVQAAARSAMAGRLLVPGSPGVTVGSTVEVKEAPQASLNSTFLVCGLRHTYSKGAGFLTQLDINQAGSASISSLLGGLL